MAASSRHWRLHVRPTLRDAVPAAHLSTFARRLVDVADDAADLREHGRLLGDHRLVLQAGRAEREAVADLINRLGMDHTEAIEEVEQARAFIYAVHQVTRESPELAERLAHELDLQGQPDFAEALRELVDARLPLQAVPTLKEITT